MKMSRVLPCLVLLLGGCALSPFGGSRDAAPGTPPVAVARPGADTPRPQMRPGPASAPLPGGTGLRPDMLDATSVAEREAATLPPSGGATLLGQTLANLGSPTEQGFWLRTGLVTRVQPGRVELVAGAGSVRVELRPSGADPSAGSQMSLAAFRALNLPLTQLVSLRVLAE